ncbi:MAG: lysostaphin resistance A-like protein [Actinomycetota bacterium]|nr:lysostaphin resistance A-like protein [Actinomycetota bacterium]
MAQSRVVRPSNGRNSASGKFSGLDGLATGLYIAVALISGLVPVLAIPALAALVPDPAVRVYLLNLVFYGLVGAIALLAAWPFVVRGVRALSARPWFTLGMIPLAIIAMLILTAVLAVIAGSARISVNQQGLESLLMAVPAWLMVPVLVVIAPFVEEYIFRHLLIGKLRRYINAWFCYLLSVALFAAIHLVGREALTAGALAPYLAMGAVLVFAYVRSGGNLMFSYTVHAAKNLLAVLLIYAVPAALLSH